MADHRPFPPSPRRSALARAAGLVAASPTLVGGMTCASAVIAVASLGRAVAGRLGSWVAGACEGSARPSSARLDITGPPHTAADQIANASRSIPRAVLELAIPLLAAIALAALFSHLAQTRAIWIPRRRIPGAPSTHPARVRRATVDLTSATVLGCVALGWLWIVAPRLASTIQVPLAAPMLIASFVTTIAIAWVALGVLDSLLRHAELGGALRMTHADKREDDRLSGSDPRWRARREELARHDRSHTSRTPGGAATDLRRAVAGSSVLVLGDAVAVVIGWDPTHRPVPAITATGRGARATQLLALARLHAIAVHRDPQLAAALSARAASTPAAAIAQSLWPRLAEIIAATRGRARSI